MYNREIGREKDSKYLFLMYLSISTAIRSESTALDISSIDFQEQQKNNKISCTSNSVEHTNILHLYSNGCMMCDVSYYKMS